MSNPEDSATPTEREALRELERAVGDALERLGELHRRARSAETKSGELEELLRKFTGDSAEAGRMISRLKALEEENTDLRGRIAKGREGVERMLARLRFLEEQR